MPEPGRWDAKLNRIHFIPHNATDAKSLNCTGIYTFFWMQVRENLYVAVFGFLVPYFERDVIRLPTPPYGCC